MASLTMAMIGADAAVRGVEDLLTKDRTTLFKNLGAEQVSNILARVDRREGVEGGTYPASKRAKIENSRTLEDQGQMLKALKAKSWTDSEVTIGFGSALEAQKAVWNQYGTRAFTVGKGKAFPMKMGGEVIWSRKKAATPPRPFFGISKTDLAKLVEKAQAFYDRKIREYNAK